MLIDIRVPPPLTSLQAFHEITEVVKQYEIAHPKVSVKLKIESLTDPYEADRHSPLILALSSSISEVVQQSATLIRKTGTGDMNELGKVLKIPTVTYGPGDSHLDHTPNENIDIQEYLQSIEVYRQTFRKLAERCRS
jgi:LysW-gamma-L-lysine carboxypeptidase